MKRILSLLAFLTASLALTAQVIDPVSWSGSAEHISGNKYILKAKASIEHPWHIYSLSLPENGPMPTEFEFVGADKTFALIGKTGEPKPDKIYDENFKMDITWFSRSVTFTQQIEIKEATLKSITAEVTYMACDDTQCLAPETKEIIFKLPEPKKEAAKEVIPEVKNEVKKQETVLVPVSAEPTKQDTLAQYSDIITAVQSATIDTVQVAPSAQIDQTAPPSTQSAGLLKTFLFAFAAGLLALLTPCVFPMIPMTVSFFMKRSSVRSKGIRDAMLYGASIVAIYLILGVGVSAIFGATALNELSTDPWFNIFFFVLLIVFAASFLGAFELTLPSSWVNKMDKNSDKAGFIGIFFMAFTLALVSFSCTGPFVGTVLVEAASTGNYWGPIVGMIGFSSALALPFTLFAIFPSWLSGLPKSGGWLNSVKVVLGFIEIAFALKFLSNADMVWDLHILEREVFIALWVVIFALLGMYLLGKIRLPHDSPADGTSVSGLFLAIVSLSFAVYMLPGIWGAPVKIISAFAPPLTYSESPDGLFGSPQAVITNTNIVDGLHTGPQGIPVFTDMDKAKTYAKAVNRPLLVDFTGKACVNCRKMEADVWSNATVKKMLSVDFVVVELFVDFREKLPEDQQYVSSTGKKIKTVGQKWSDYQVRRFGINAQPYYVIMDSEENVLGPTRAMNLDVNAYIEWLEKGIIAYQNRM